MDATPGDFLMHPAASDAARGDSPSALADKWTALHAAADVIAALAGMTGTVPAFPSAIASGWRRDLARQGIDDLVAMLEPGLAALLNLHAQGGDPRPAATALWQEFDRARRTVLGVAGPID
jgi:hypothetical protein